MIHDVLHICCLFYELQYQICKAGMFPVFCVFPISPAFGTVPTHGRHSINSEIVVTIMHVYLDIDDCSPAKLLHVI